MDVSLWPSRALRASLLLVCLTITASCGNRFDLDTPRGLRSRIEDANQFLSKSQCEAALEAIPPAYESTFVTNEVRLVMASAYACRGTFNFLTLVGNLAQEANPFRALVRSLANRPNDGGRSAMYQAMDVLTEGGTKLSASQRAAAVNSYMVFLQLGVVATILRNYGSPGVDGSQGADLVYEPLSNPAGEVSNVDACALGGALATIVDSFLYSGLQDAETAAVTSELESVCQSAGLSTCGDLNRDRSACNGSNNESIAAALIVAGINAAW